MDTLIDLWFPVVPCQHPSLKCVGIPFVYFLGLLFVLVCFGSSFPDLYGGHLQAHYFAGLQFLVWHFFLPLLKNILYPIVVLLVCQAQMFFRRAVIPSAVLAAACE